MPIVVCPATVFADVKTLLGPKRPDANVCWCLGYRLASSKENRGLQGTARGERVKRLCGQDPPPGVLAYDGDEVVGWAGVHPRADTSFARNRKAADTDSVLNGFPRVLMRLDLRPVRDRITPGGPFDPPGRRGSPTRAFRPSNQSAAAAPPWEDRR